MTEFDGRLEFTSRPRARRIIDGEPDGENFTIAELPARMTSVYRNMVVWNSSTVGDGEFINNAIMLGELPLPGATDVGDVDQNGELDLSDPILILEYLFLSGWQPRRRVADADLSGTIDFNDAVSILEYLFLGGRRPG